MSKVPATSGNKLPSEIIEAILCLLPAKSTARFKSVSKRWNSLISDPQFIKTHLLQNIHRQIITKLIIVSDTQSLYSVDISELFHCINNDHLSASRKELGFRSPLIRWEEILGSCNGLVLAKDENDTMFILNPTTQEVWEIPLSPFALPAEEGFVKLKLGFTIPYEKGFVKYGFGYDSSTDDYKVVWIVWDPHSDRGDDILVIVYSLRNNSWRKLPNSYDHTGDRMGVVHVNQNLHWLASTRESSLTLIVAFSLASEEFNEIKMPVRIEYEGDPDCDLVALGGKLVVYVSNETGYDLWVMEEYGVDESWTRLCIHGVEIDYVKPVCLVLGSDRDIVLDDLNEGEVVVYNMDGRRCRSVRITGGTGGFRFIVGGAYVETLESPKRLIAPR